MGSFKAWLDEMLIMIIEEGRVGDMVAFKLQLPDGRQPVLAFSPDALDQRPEDAIGMVVVILNEAGASEHR